MGRWVQVGGCWLVSKWGVGCVVLPPPTPPTTNISLLSDVRQRTNLAWRANNLSKYMQTTAPRTNIYFIVRAKRVSNCYMQEKKKLAVRVSGCSANLGFSVENCLGFSVAYVYGQSTVYLCLSKYIVVQTQTGEGVPIQPAA